MRSPTWRDERHMLLGSSHQEFNAQTTVICNGAPLDKATMRSRLVHTSSPQQRADLADFRELGVQEGVLLQVAGMVDRQKRNCILYCFFHMSESGRSRHRVLDGLTLTTGQEAGWKLLNIWFTNQRAVDAVMTATEYVANWRKGDSVGLEEEENN
jgi:hypothetical protein